jgi:hypothetical protein
MSGSAGDVEEDSLFNMSVLRANTVLGHRRPSAVLRAYEQYETGPTWVIQ